MDRIDVAAFARSHVVDERVRCVLPTFDAPYQQAGLAGYSDVAMRVVAREHGAPYAITEAHLDRYVAEGLHDCDAEGLFPLREHAASRIDRPLAVQLIGDDPGAMATAAAALAAMTAEGGPAAGRIHAIDVNLACPVKKVARKRRGGHWLGDPDGAIEILRAVREAVPPGLATTAKMRRGSDDSEQAEARFHTVFDAAYELGYAWATVHARTVEQKYVGPSRWPFLENLVRWYPDRPILGSGDIWSAWDVYRMVAYTGVSAVSVARGCIGNPWLFRQARDLAAGRSPRPPTLAEQRAVLERHLELAVAVHGPRRASLSMRKFGIRFAAHHPRPADVRSAVKRAGSPAEWRAAIDAAYPPTLDRPDGAT